MLSAGTAIRRDYFLTIPFTSTTSSYSFILPNIYAPLDHCDTDSFLSELTSLAPPDEIAWLIIGDFNLTRSPANKNTSNFNWSLDDKFNNAIGEKALIELPLLDRLYT